MKKCIFAGSFDPLHQGHKDVVKKALELFDKVYIVVANNSEKQSSDISARFSAVKRAFCRNKNVEVVLLEKGLLADLAKELEVSHLVRSARDGKDYDYELLLAHGYKRDNKNLETIIIVPDVANIKLRSSLFPKEGN